VQDLSLTYADASGGLEALNNVSFDVADREFLCVLGPSGSGKSTLLRVLAGLVPPTRGIITFSTTQRPRIGLVFQQANLMPWRRVLENITLPLELLSIPPDQAQQQARNLIVRMGLQGFEQSYPAELSGGMAQRVAIARALIQDPDLLLLDEPFGALDALTRERMSADLLELWQGQQKTLIMVTHSISEALLLADRVLVLTPRPGQISLELPVRLSRPRVADVRYTPEFAALAKKLRAAIG
jgi:NitT/TauT family transport system ATP-binding protein